jgi:hypothetical protein
MRGVEFAGCKPGQPAAEIVPVANPLPKSLAGCSGRPERRRLDQRERAYAVRIAERKEQRSNATVRHPDQVRPFHGQVVVPNPGHGDSSARAMQPFVSSLVRWSKNYA